MKACVLHGVGNLVYEEVPRPPLKDGEVMIHIKACGICGSDIPRVFTKGTYHFPTIPGHEFSGTVVEVNDNVSGEWLGRRVAVFPLIPCRHCEPCARGSYAQCENYDYFGSRRDGAFSEYLSVPVWNLVPIPDSVPYEEAAMAEPAAVAYHAVSRANIRAGENVLVAGAGTIGLIVAMWARISGAAKIIVTDVAADNIAFAEKLGFTALSSTAPDLSGQIQRATGGKGVLYAFDCAGNASALESCLANVNAFGTVIALGNPARDMLIHQNEYWNILRKELTVSGTWNSGYLGKNNDWAKVMQALASGQLELHPLITHRFALADHKEAFRIMRERSEFVVKVMFVN